MSDGLMDESDWIGVVVGIRARWPHADLPDSTIAVWREAVKDLPVEQVMAAIEVIYRDGREFPPNGGQIRKKVMELRDDAPQWGEVWRWVRKAQMKAPAFAGDTDGRDPFLREKGHDLAADFMAHIGWPLPDEWTDDNLESRLRRKWEEWMRDRAEGRNLAGLPSAGLKRLERGDGPRKLPAGAIADAIARDRGLPPGGGTSGPTSAGLTLIHGGRSTGPQMQ